MAFNLFAIGYQNWRYGRNQTLQLYPDKLVYRTLDMKKEQVITVTGDSVVSKDWKGIHVKNDNMVQSISIEFMSKKEGDRLFSEIQTFYA